jgi:hypothetical protein
MGNTYQRSAVEVSSGDIQRGHWSFGLGSLERGFYPSESTETIILANFSEIKLDENRDFINAVRVVARRDSTPVASFIQVCITKPFVFSLGHFFQHFFGFPDKLRRKGRVVDGQIFHVLI